LLKSKREKEKIKIKTIFQQHAWTFYCKSFMNNLEDESRPFQEAQEASSCTREWTLSRV
jgi:hypothetical protein